MRCESYTYRGFIIYKNPQSKDFSTSYMSIVNPKIKLPNGKLAHCHVNSGDYLAKRIIDCACCIDRYGYAKASRSIKNKAMKLNGLYIYSVH